MPLRRTTRALLAGLFLSAPLGPRALASGDPGDAVSSITEDVVDRHVRVLAAPGMEGRDSPSEGLARAAAYISARFADAGVQPAPDAEDVWKDQVDGEFTEADRYLRPFRLRLPSPDPKGCSLELTLEGEDAPVRYALGEDFVPAPLCEGKAEGELVFASFGISSKDHHYDDLKKLRLEDKIALVFEGEPRHRRKFDGPEVTVEASLWTKLDRLMEEDVAGVLVVRRAPEGGEDDAENRLDFRYTYATFNGDREPTPPRRRVPVLEVSMACASSLLGTDALEVVEKLDRTGRPGKVKTDGRRVRLSSAIEQTQVRLDNVVGVLPGSDPALADQYVVVGAHYDHIGVDPRGRVGAGADDNASGTAALLAVVDALAAARPRRSILVCFFCSEEDGLVGSKEICKRLPVEKDGIVAMLNLDMVGRGDEKEVVVLGVKRTPEFEDVLERANKLSRTGVREIVMRKGEELWQRSDHHSFHELGIPSLFFFEGLPVSRNEDYHTWRDTPDGVDPDKIARTARLVFNTAWILADDDERPPAPKR